MDIKDRVGQRLKALRKEKGITQEKLSFESDVDKTYISEVENGKRNISMVNLEKLVLTVGFSLRDFFDDDSFAWFMPYKRQLEINSLNLCVMMIPNPVYLFRIVHWQNIEYILRHGLCSNNHTLKDPQYINIGHTDTSIRFLWRDMEIWENIFLFIFGDIPRCYI